MQRALFQRNKGYPAQNDIYLVHEEAEGLGEKTLKWFWGHRLGEEF